MESLSKPPAIPNCDRSYEFTYPSPSGERVRREAEVAAKLSQLVSQLPADVRYRSLDIIVREDSGLRVGEATYLAMEAIDGFPGKAEAADQMLPEDAVA